MYLVAFDPGETTGVAVAQWEEGAGRNFGLVRSSEIYWGERFHGVKRLLKVYKPQYIIVESFRLYSHRAQSQIGKTFPSSQVIGIIETYAYELGLLDRVRIQPASVRSSVKIPKDHYSQLGKTAHQKDAYKHLRYFIIVYLPKEVGS